MSAIAVTLMVLAGCSSGAEEDTMDSTGGSGASPPASEGAEVPLTDAEVPATAEPPPLVPLTRDQPGGPAHDDVATRPTRDELASAAAAPPDRLSAERFALLMIHAIENQTESDDGGFELYVSAELPEPARATIDQSRSFPGNRIASDEHAWLRSVFQQTGETVGADVYAIEKVISPFMDDGSDPYIFWSATRVTVTHDSRGWLLADLSQGGASESETFSSYAYESQLDSGRGWRRVPLS